MEITSKPIAAQKLKMNAVNYYSLLVFLFSLLHLQSFTQVPNFAHVPNLNLGDSANISHLINIGIKIHEKNIIAWFPKDSLSKKQMRKIVDTLNMGVEAAEAIVNAPLSWQVHQKGNPYTFYFRLDSFISHASGAGFVSIPFWRIKKGEAPWLHETIHEMLNSKKGTWSSDSIPEKQWSENMPLWLAEGLPEYISIQASQKVGLLLFDVFSNSYYTNADSICKEDLKGAKADHILSFVGKKGVMPELFGSDRRLYAPTFYHCSCSFVKYIADSYGIEPLLMSLSSFSKEHEILEEKTSQSIENLKSEWLKKIINN